MKQVRLLAVVPYEGMKEVLAETGAVKSGRVQMDMYTGDLETGLSAVRSLDLSGYAAILSRGGTAELLEREQDLPVVDVSPTLLDVLRCLRIARSISDRYAVVGFPAIADVAEKMFSLIERQEEIRVIHNRAEARDTVLALKTGGYDLVVGDAVTVSSAREINLNAMLITSGLESAETAIEEALRIERACSAARRKADVLEALLLSGQEYRFIFTENGASYLKHVPEDPQTAQKLEEAARELLPDLKSCGTLKRIIRVKKDPWRFSGSCITMGSDALYLFEIGQGKYYSSEKHEPAEPFIPAEYKKEGAVDNIGKMKDILDRAEKLSAKKIPLLMNAAYGTPEEDVLRTVFLASEFCHNTGYWIRCKSLTDSGLNKLLNDENSPFMENESIFCFTDTDALSETGLAALLSFAKETRFFSRDQIIVCARNDRSESLRKFAARSGCAVLSLPELRDRREDIPAVAGMYISEWNYRMGKQIIGITPEGLRLLTQERLPGNNKQLKNMLRDAMIAAAGEMLEAKDLSLIPHAVSAEGVYDGELHKTLEEIDRAAARSALRWEDGNRQKAADRLGISRTTLWRLLKDDSNEK